VVGLLDACTTTLQLGGILALIILIVVGRCGGNAYLGLLAHAHGCVLDGDHLYAPIGALVALGSLGIDLFLLARFGLFVQSRHWEVS